MFFGTRHNSILSQRNHLGMSYVTTRCAHGVLSPPSEQVKRDVDTESSAPCRTQHMYERYSCSNKDQLTSHRINPAATAGGGAVACSAWVGSLGVQQHWQRRKPRRHVWRQAERTHGGTSNKTSCKNSGMTRNEKTKFGRATAQGIATRQWLTHHVSFANAGATEYCPSSFICRVQVDIWEDDGGVVRGIHHSQVGEQGDALTPALYPNCANTTHVLPFKHVDGTTRSSLTL